MENVVAILWKNNLQLFAKSTCKKHPEGALPNDIFPQDYIK
jgi:hypothetical protein